MVRTAWVVSLALVGAGCATTPKWAAATTMAEEKFPPRAELQKVALRVPKLDTAKHDRAAVDSWTLEGPFPSEATVTPVKPSTPWELALVQAVPAVGNALAADQQCIAREVARFLLARKDYPGNSLQAFIERRCGTTAPQVHLSSLTGELPDQVTEAEWLAQWKDDLGKQAQALGTPDVAGLAVRREGKRAVMVLASADVGARYAQPIPLVGTTGTVVVRGRLAQGGVERIGALINKGALGVEPCKTLDALSPPEFAFECPVDASDVRTTLELARFEAGRILGGDRDHHPPQPDAARSEAGLAQWTLWPQDEGAVVAANLASKRWDPNEAAHYALEKTAEVAKGRVNGYVQLVDDLDNFQFPPEVLSRPDINVFLAVGVYRGEEWAQSRYVVCFVIARANDIETASR